MAISKKLPSENQGEKLIKEKEVLDLINKGGKTPFSNKKEGKPIVGFNLRLPRELFNEVDKCRLKNYGVSSSKHNWIINAIIEKIDREK